MKPRRCRRRLEQLSRNAAIRGRLTSSQWKLLWDASETTKGEEASMLKTRPKLFQRGTNSWPAVSVLSSRKILYQS